MCQSSLLAATEKTGSENVFLTKYRSLKNNVYMSPYWEGKKKKVAFCHCDIDTWAAELPQSATSVAISHIRTWVPRRSSNIMHFWWIFSSHCNRVERWTVKTKIHVKKNVLFLNNSITEYSNCVTCSGQYIRPLTFPISAPVTRNPKHWSHNHQSVLRFDLVTTNVFNLEKRKEKNIS